MLTRKPSFVAEDAQGGSPLFTPQEMPSLFAIVPPTPAGGPQREGGEPESCRLVSVNLSAYLDDELDADQAQLVTDHLNTCPGCAGLLDAMESMDVQIEREWRDSTPLPSSSQFRHSIDAIMDALPPAAAEAERFAPKRVHARTRWMRFATGMSGFILAAGLLWSSYRLGYAHGRTTAKRSSFATPPVNPNSVRNQQAQSLAALSDPPSSPQLTAASLTFTRARRSQR